MLLAQDAEQRMERTMMAQQVKASVAKFEQVTEDLGAVKADRERFKAERDALQTELLAARAQLRKQSVRLATVEEQQDWLRGQVSRLAERILAPADSNPSDTVLLPVGEIRIVVERVHAALYRNQTEMTWRRLEMKRAQQAPSGLLARLRGMDAKAIMGGWDRVPAPKFKVLADPPVALGEKEIPAIKPSETAKSTPLEPSSTPTSSPTLEVKP
jgi:septal ring factor EnvC (AmiA/AmiB activator)